MIGFPIQGTIIELFLWIAVIIIVGAWAVWWLAGRGNR